MEKETPSLEQMLREQEQRALIDQEQERLHARFLELTDASMAAFELEDRAEVRRIGMEMRAVAEQMKTLRLNR